MTVSQSADRADAIQARIRQLQASLPETVRLIAVSKRQPASAVRAAYAVGLRDFGESQLQEAIAKQAELADLSDITWHFIGHLQSNKVRKAIKHFPWIHSVDSLKLARRIDQIAAELGAQPQGCLQVKIVPDPPKYGFSVSELQAALPELDQLTHLRCVGLMTIPPLDTSPEGTRQIFEQVRALAEEINHGPWQRLRISTLSMGMSGDYPLAIAAGATMIRLGTTLFGDRQSR
ncbi:MAG: YggS family pyridoxal phosphate-dependent enzyme [Leptolyngbyaceae cyanobacterium T60_A2020_046]|nr:YggS family pyridoxal phosphate-dependent enzyme [Leptolyngbyaceae cyanobacterium T60_A2020_046]